MKSIFLVCGKIIPAHYIWKLFFMSILFSRNVSLHLSSVIVLMCTVQSHVACKPKDICGVGLNETCHSPRVRYLFLFI